jgi:hypothetical protein
MEITIMHMQVDDVVEGIFQRLCIRERYGQDAADRSMGVVELRVALGVTEAQLNEALRVLSFPGDKRIEYPAKDRVALGADWRPRCDHSLFVILLGSRQDCSCRGAEGLDSRSEYPSDADPCEEEAEGPRPRAMQYYGHPHLYIQNLPHAWPR